MDTLMGTALGWTTKSVFWAVFQNLFFVWSTVFEVAQKCSHTGQGRPYSQMLTPKKF